MSAFSASVNGCLARSRAGRAACETGRLGDWERGREREREGGDRHTHQLFHRRVFPALFWRTKKRIISPSSSGSRSSVDRHVWNERTNEEERTTTKRGEKMKLASRPRRRSGRRRRAGQGEPSVRLPRPTDEPDLDHPSSTRRHRTPTPPTPPTRPPDTRRPMRGIHCRAVRLPMKKKYI